MADQGPHISPDPDGADPTQVMLIQWTGKMLKALQAKDLEAAYAISQKILELDPNSAVAKEYHELLRQRVAQLEEENAGSKGEEDENDEDEEADEDDDEDAPDGTEDDAAWGANSIMARLERFESEGPEAMEKVKAELIEMGILTPAKN
jgi:hypothetical protein